MLPFKPKGAIFDVDDTLLDNKGKPRGLHEQSRYAAVHEIGRRHNIAAFKKWNYEENYRAFHEAPTHNLIGALWNTLLMTGLRTDITPNPDDPLITELFEAKMRLHEVILRRNGKAYPGAVDFVRALAESGPWDKLAVATTAYRRDLDIFFEMSGLARYFPDERIISIESVTKPKPDPEVFNLAFASINLPESDRKYVCAFEDNPRGIKSAHDAGLYVCAITNIFPKNELERLDPAPNLIADSFAEFAESFGLRL